MRRFLFSLMLLSFGALSWTPSSALPRFALMQGTKCQSCHVNPTGGGIRNEFGMTFSTDKLPPESTKDEEFAFNGKLTENITLGADYRGQFVYDHSSKTTAFQAMTAAIYGSVQLNKKYYFIVKQDLVNPGYGQTAGQFPGPEAYGLAKFFSRWYVKGGVFLPNYGWRLDDHSAYVRSGDLGFLNGSLYHNGLIFTPNYKDIGIELGGSVGGLFVSGGIFDGNGNQYQMYPTDKKAYALKAEYNGSMLDELNFDVGVSAYGYDAMTMNGITAGLAFGSFTFIGELDLTNNYNPNGTSAADTSNPGGKTMASHLELDMRALQGLWLVGMFDIFDPIQGISANEVKRITAGIEFFPYAFVEVRPQYRHVMVEEPKTTDDQLIVQMHLWF